MEIPNYTGSLGKPPWRAGTEGYDREDVNLVAHIIATAPAPVRLQQIKRELLKSSDRAVFLARNGEILNGILKKLKAWGRVGQARATAPIYWHKAETGR